MEASKKHYWRADITGLRALAVIPVLLFHAFPQLMPGGFVGVDVFFVISGYLISGILFRDLQRTGTIDFFDFYSKRIKRILPNLIVLLLVVTVFGWFVLTASEYEVLGKHVYSSAFFFQNFRLLGEAGDYFDIGSAYKPLLHLWSLAIEEQFYILFPVVLLMVWKVVRRKNLGILLMGMTVGSFAYCLAQDMPSRAFYFPFCRFWELGAGIMLSYAEHFKILERGKNSATLFDHMLSGVGALLIIAALCTLDGKTPFPGWFALMPVGGAVLIIAASPKALVNQVLSIKPVVFIGLVSYSLYLWHWPFLSYLSIVVPKHSELVSILALLASAGAAIFVYALVENPVRRVKLLPQMRRLDVGLLIGVILIFGLGQIIRSNDGFPNRAINAHFERSEPLLTKERLNELPVLKINGVDVRVSDAKNLPEILFIGDSHMRQYFSRIITLAKERGITVGFVTSGGCLTLPGVEPLRATCGNAIKVYDALLTSEIKRFVLFDRWGAYMGEEKENFWRNRDGLDAALARLRRKLADAKIEPSRFYVGLDNPWGDEFDVKRHLKNRLTLTKDSFDVSIPLPEEGLWAAGNAAVKRQLTGAAVLIDGVDQVCPNRICDLKNYVDDNHLSESYTEKKAVWIDQVFDGL